LKAANGARKTGPTKPAGAEIQGSWLTIEVDRAALTANIAVFRGLIAPGVKLMAVVKADAYGHGLLLASEAFLAGGADVLGVHSVSEAVRLREAGLTAPILVLGPADGGEAARASELGVELTVASVAALEAAAYCGAGLKLHLKVETGVNRQGLVEAEMERALQILDGADQLEIAGLSSHFADIEDTTDHSYAKSQMARFASYRDLLTARGHQPVEHMSCSAATLLWDRSHAGMARVGVSAYGVWPSKETRVSFRQRGRPEIELKPAVAWKVLVSQVRDVPAGETVGYGRVWKAMTDSRIAVLPVGYSDGWPRNLSGRGHVLVRGKRAPLVGRICMNLCMVDVTHVPGAEAGDEAVLLGRQGNEVITPEMLAADLGTIPYEILTLPGATWTRVGIG